VESGETRSWDRMEEAFICINNAIKYK